MSIFMPKTITAGFQERSGTYTGQLAYVIYTDEKGVLRKEKSWNSWRDKKIEPVTYDNVPTSGFVLNKKAGGYSTGWNHRQTYVRVYDPRGLEFEISIPNLLYILENTNSIKGKGLEGEFVYGWDGTELLLIPTSAPDYQELIAYNEAVHNKTTIKAKDLKIGATYKSKQNEDLIYMGRFDYYDYGTNKGKQHFFAKLRDKSKSLWYYDYQEGDYNFQSYKSLSGKLISVIDDNCVSNYAEIFEELECRTCYSPIDKSKNEYIPYTFEEFSDKVLNGYRWGEVFYYNGLGRKVITNVDNKTNQKYFVVEIYNERHYSSRQDGTFDTLEEVFNHYKPCYLNEYLENGKLYKVGK